MSHEFYNRTERLIIIIFAQKISFKRQNLKIKVFLYHLLYYCCYGLTREVILEYEKGVRLCSELERPILF